MPKKDSNPCSYDSIPALAKFYVAAHVKHLGVEPYVRTKMYGRFRVFEDDLRVLGYSSREYAYTIVILLKKWLISKEFEVIPVNTFTGDWALAKYTRIASSKYVDISNVNVDYDLYYSEKTIARTYVEDNINGRAIRFFELVEELKSLLSQHWLDRYYSGRSRPIDKVLDELCEEYGIRFAATYVDLVRRIRSDISI